MEMMPDIAVCDPEVTMSMPPHITAETGMDAMTHAVEALVSQRANYVSNILAAQAVKDIFAYLPLACKDGADMQAREGMLNASMVAGLAFTKANLLRGRDLPARGCPHGKRSRGRRRICREHNLKAP